VSLLLPESFAFVDFSAVSGVLYAFGVTALARVSPVPRLPFVVGVPAVVCAHDVAGIPAVDGTQSTSYSCS